MSIEYVFCWSTCYLTISNVQFVHLLVIWHDFHRLGNGSCGWLCLLLFSFMSLLIPVYIFLTSSLKTSLSWLSLYWVFEYEFVKSLVINNIEVSCSIIMYWLFLNELSYLLQQHIIKLVSLRKSSIVKSNKNCL